jgi:ankyrin repeat protein
VHVLLEAGALPDPRDKAGATPLLLACAAGHFSAATTIVETSSADARATMRPTAGTGGTALHLALAAAAARVSDAVAAGSEVAAAAAATAAEGVFSLLDAAITQWSSQLSATDIAAALNVPDAEGTTLVHLAAAAHNAAALQLLLENGARRAPADRRGRHPLERLLPDVALRRCVMLLLGTKEHRHGSTDDDDSDDHEGRARRSSARQSDDDDDDD